MSYSYKTYTDTRGVMKKYVNASEGAIIYSLGKTHLMVLAKEAGAIYKVGASALINIEIFDKYLEKFHEPEIPLPRHTWGNIHKKDDLPEECI